MFGGTFDSIEILPPPPTITLRRNQYKHFIAFKELSPLSLGLQRKSRQLTVVTH